MVSKIHVGSVFVFAQRDVVNSTARIGLKPSILQSLFYRVISGLKAGEVVGSVWAGRCGRERGAVLIQFYFPADQPELVRAPFLVFVAVSPLIATDRRVKCNLVVAEINLIIIGKLVNQARRITVLGAIALPIQRPHIFISRLYLQDIGAIHQPGRYIVTLNGLPSTCVDVILSQFIWQPPTGFDLCAPNRAIIQIYLIAIVNGDIKCAGCGSARNIKAVLEFNYISSHRVLHPATFPDPVSTAGKGVTSEAVVPM